MEVNLKQFWTDKRKLFLLSVIHLKFTKQTKNKYLKTRVASIPPSLPKNIWGKKKVNRLFNIFQTSKIVYCRPSNLATYFLTSRMCQLIWSHTEKKYFTTFSPIFGYNLSYPCVYLKMHKICVWFIPYTRVIHFWWHDQLDFEFFFWYTTTLMLRILRFWQSASSLWHFV